MIIVVMNTASLLINLGIVYCLFIILLETRQYARLASATVALAALRVLVIGLEVAFLAGANVEGSGLSGFVSMIMSASLAWFVYELMRLIILRAGEVE